MDALVMGGRMNAKGGDGMRNTGSSKQIQNVLNRKLCSHTMFKTNYIVARSTALNLYCKNILLKIQVGGDQWTKKVMIMRGRGGGNDNSSQCMTVLSE